MNRACVVAVLAVCALGCQKDKEDPNGGRPALGKERGDCKVNKACDPGLLCLSNLCVRPPPADCTAVAEGLASMDLGNYAEPEERAPVVSKYRAACDKAYVSKEQGECFAKATTKWAAQECAPDMFPELKSSGSGDCQQIAQRVRAQMGSSMTGSDPQTAQMFEKVMRVVKESCEQDAWPDGFKKCVLAAGNSADAMSACNSQMPAALQQKMTERMAKTMQ
jgi:hypothetical protein